MLFDVPHRQVVADRQRQETISFLGPESPKKMTISGSSSVPSDPTGKAVVGATLLQLARSGSTGWIHSRTWSRQGLAAVLASLSMVDKFTEQEGWNLAGLR
jgi:hypothetical protein